MSLKLIKCIECPPTIALTAMVMGDTVHIGTYMGMVVSYPVSKPITAVLNQFLYDKMKEIGHGYIEVAYDGKRKSYYYIRS